MHKMISCSPQPDVLFDRHWAKKPLLTRPLLQCIYQQCVSGYQYACQTYRSQYIEGSNKRALAGPVIVQHPSPLDGTGQHVQLPHQGPAYGGCCMITKQTLAARQDNQCKHSEPCLLEMCNLYAKAAMSAAVASLTADGSCQPGHTCCLLLVI